MMIKIGLIGAGKFAIGHLNSLTKMEGVKIVSICDVDIQRARTAAQKYGAAAYTDYRLMVESETIDALYICVPPFAHQDMEILAAKKGIHLFVEKPVHLNLKEAKRISSVIKKADIISCVGYQYRYSDVTDRLKKYLEGKEIGFFTGNWIETIPRDRAWWWVKEKSGGAENSFITHLIDLSRYLFGEVKEVFALSRDGLMKGIEDYNIHDASIITLHFQNGIIGTMASSIFFKSDFARKISLEIYCPETVVEYNFCQEHKVKIIEENGIKEMKSSKRKDHSIDEVFIKAVKKKDPSGIKSTYQNAVKTLEIVLSANQSIETGKVIKL